MLAIVLATVLAAIPGAEALAVPTSDVAGLDAATLDTTPSAIAPGTISPEEAAGLEVERITAHTLRHTFAARYQEANPRQLVELAALPGHSNLNTMAVYTQPSFAGVAAKLDEPGPRRASRHYLLASPDPYLAPEAGQVGPDQAIYPRREEFVYDPDLDR